MGSRGNFEDDRIGNVIKDLFCDAKGAGKPGFGDADAFALEFKHSEEFVMSKLKCFGCEGHVSCGSVGCADGVLKNGVFVGSADVEAVVGGQGLHAIGDDKPLCRGAGVEVFDGNGIYSGEEFFCSV